MITINDNIRYIPAAHDPLSADVVFIETPEHMYIFDVGSNEQSAQANESVKKDKTVVLSHFHQDHIKNIEKITYQNLYVSKQTFKYTHKGTVINETTELDQSSQIRLFLLPSTHAKGCIMLCYKEEYAFLGDALYPAAVKGKTVYNCQLLKQTIDILKDLKVKYLVISHDKEFLHLKEEVIKRLEMCYDRREAGSNYIELQEWS